MTEEWRPVPSLPGIEASTAGRIRRASTGLIYAASMTRGYLALRPAGATRRHYVARMVCEAFHGAPPSPRHEAAHSDGDHQNNAPSNLRWATSQENKADMVAHGTAPRGARNAMSRLTEEQAQAIRRDLRPAREIAAAYGIHSVHVGAIRRGRRWRHVEAPIANDLRTKLSSEQIASIRADPRPGIEIARAFAISPAAVSMIRRGLRRKQENR